MAVALRRDLACMVYLQGRSLKDWRLSHKAARNPGDGVSVLKRWIAIYHPEVVVCQNPDTATRKSARNVAILSAMAQVIADEEVYDLLVARSHGYRNIYEEASAIAERYPVLRHKLPAKPNIWESEPRRIIYFEAMSFALAVLDRDGEDRGP